MSEATDILDNATADLIVETVPMPDITSALRAKDPAWEVTELIERAVTAVVVQKNAEIAQKDLALQLVSEILRDDLYAAKRERAALWSILKRMARKNAKITA